MIKRTDDFYVSLGFSAESALLANSVFVKSVDENLKINCPPTSFDFKNGKDFRFVCLKFSTENIPSVDTTKQPFTLKVVMKTSHLTDRFLIFISKFKCNGLILDPVLPSPFSKSMTKAF